MSEVMDQKSMQQTRAMELQYPQKEAGNLGKEIGNEGSARLFEVRSMTVKCCSQVKQDKKQDLTIEVSSIKVTGDLDKFRGVLGKA